MADTIEIGAWLMQKRGGLSALPEAWLAALASLADDGEWGVEDVVTSFKSSREKFELWEAIVEAAAERLEVASGVRPSAIQMKRALLYVTWFDGKHDDVTAHDVSGGSTGDSGGDRRARSGPKPRVPEIVTPEMQKDMDEQGADSVEQLVALSVSLALGHKASDSELGDCTYGSTLSLSSGLKAAQKSSYHKTIQDFLEPAKKTGNLSDMDRFIQKFTSVLLRDTVRFWSLSGARIQSQWAELKQSAGPGGSEAYKASVAAHYLQLVMDERPCRGFPAQLDLLLLRQAETAVSKSTLVPGVSLDQLSSGTKLTSNPSHGAPSVGGSSMASGASTALNGEMVAGMKEITEELKEMRLESKKAREDTAGLTKKLDRLDSEIGRVRNQTRRGDDDEADKKIKGKCHICKKKGHRMEDCPVVKKAKQSLAEEDVEEE